MRGTPEQAPQSQLAGRIIPADAGNTSGHIVLGLRAGDHPRGCGEHSAIGKRVMQSPGSSPRMRGTLREHLHVVDDIGIIPADAGNTLTCPPALRISWDHPRGCGEHKRLKAGFGQSAGSSPRMRGTRQRRWWCMTYSLDHPRGCGEHQYGMPLSDIDDGSSPRMRGTPVQIVHVAGIGGIIPADAGNTNRL